MRKNKLKELFKAGKPIINSWLSIPSSFSAEVMANQGWDSVTIDMQHGLIDYHNAVNMLQAISTTNTTPLARVNWNEPGQIMKIDSFFKILGITYVCNFFMTFRFEHINIIAHI